MSYTPTKEELESLGFLFRENGRLGCWGGEISDCGYFPIYYLDGYLDINLRKLIPESIDDIKAVIRMVTAGINKSPN